MRQIAALILADLFISSQSPLTQAVCSLMERTQRPHCFFHNHGELNQISAFDEEAVQRVSESLCCVKWITVRAVWLMTARSHSQLVTVTLNISNSFTFFFFSCDHLKMLKVFIHVLLFQEKTWQLIWFYNVVMAHKGLCDREVIY